jgi:hypothetical protein
MIFCQLQTLNSWIYLPEMSEEAKTMGNMVEYHMNFLFAALGTHEKVAEALGYTNRHYRKIRIRIEKGEKLPARIENLMKGKVRDLQLAGVCHVGQ